MNESVYLVFGDLHGRVLPAFKLAGAWSRRHGIRVNGILQVGDLGYFPDTSRLDKATLRHASQDPMELGVQLVTQPSKEADVVLSDPDSPATLWFTAGNHEDFEALQSLERGSGSRASSFPVDDYLRLRCIRDGSVEELPGGMKVGALWGVDRQTRKNLPPRGWIDAKSARNLAYSGFDILLTHDSPSDTMLAGSGSEDIDHVLRNAQPLFAFFGHYKGNGTRIEGDFGRTQVFHLAGMELRRRSIYPEEGSVGVLRWSQGAGTFEYVDSEWLMNYPRAKWLHWE